jgi:hypothetical protein
VARAVSYPDILLRYEAATPSVASNRESFWSVGRGTHEDARGVVAAGHRRQLVRVRGVLDAPSRELAALLLERRAQRGLFAWLAAAGSQLAKLTKRRLTFSSLCNRWSLSRV